MFIFNYSRVIGTILHDLYIILCLFTNDYYNSPRDAEAAGTTMCNGHNYYISARQKHISNNARLSWNCTRAHDTGMQHTLSILVIELLHINFTEFNWVPTRWAYLFRAPCDNQMNFLRKSQIFCCPRAFVILLEFFCRSLL